MKKEKEIHDKHLKETKEQLIAEADELEKLNELKKQSSVLTLRFITDEYSMPLGVWLVREATRKALQNKPVEFSDRELMLKYAKAFIKRKFNFDLDKILDKSVLLKSIKNQSKLVKFL